MKRMTMIAATAGAVAVLGLGGTAMAAGMTGDAPAATSGLGASPSASVSADRTPGASASSSSARLPDGPVSRAEAVAIARAYAGAGTVREVESDDVRDVPVWKVEFDTDGGRREIDVDRATGAVIGDDTGSRGRRGR